MDSKLRNILLIGHQAREHAFAWRLALSKRVKRIYMMPGNPALAGQPKILLLNRLNTTDLIAFCQKNTIDCVVVGTTAAMESGIVDACQASNIPVIGANRQSVQLEASKLFAKQFMQRHGIPTPTVRVVNTMHEFNQYQSISFPCVLKAERVIKGCYSAITVNNKREALEAGQKILRMQKDAYDGGCLLVEPFCSGRELSFTLMMDDNHWLALPPCQDYKKLLDGNAGPNTGGMGSIAPVSWLTETQYQTIIQTIVEPTMQAMLKEGLRYRGFLYLGIIFNESGLPLLMEYNCRLGDPEGQSLLMLMDSDLADVTHHMATGKLFQLTINWRKGAAVSVYLVPQGYPNACLSRQVISLPETNFTDDTRQCFVGTLQSGETNQQENQWLTGNNRTCCISAYADTIGNARNRAYQTVNEIRNESECLFYREDIGLDL